MEEKSFKDMAPLVRDLLGIDPARKEHLKEATRLVRGYAEADSLTGAVNTPIYQTATFAHPAYGMSTGFGYSRYGNPTRLELENTLAMLEHGKKAWAFSSGMAAISTVIKLFGPKDHILVSDDLYGGTYRLFHDIYAKYGLTFDYIDTTEPEHIKSALRKNTRCLFIETPTNPMMKVTDLRAAADIIHGSGGLFIVDNTFLTPYFQKPMDFGADIVLHSGTKYLGGHNDILAGFIIAAREEQIEPIFMLAMSEGGMLSPGDSWLMLRSLKTLAIRMQAQQESALTILEFLKSHPKVGNVYYVGDPDHAQYKLSLEQTSGFGGMMSFSLKRAEDVPPLINRLKLILFAESLGGVETLLTFPYMQTHGAIPEEMRERLGVNNRLLRLSVGLEDADDLISDLAQALG
jgi:cystathionine gamma-synthase